MGLSPKRFGNLSPGQFWMLRRHKAHQSDQAWNHTRNVIAAIYNAQGGKVKATDIMRIPAIDGGTTGPMSEQEQTEIINAVFPDLWQAE